MPSLDLMGIQVGTDKSRLYQNYLVHYERMLKGFHGRPLTLLEIGVHRGASLKLWERYFPLATIIGVDNEPAMRRYAKGRVSVEIGSQFDDEFLKTLAEKYSPDILIDDGSHIGEHQIFTFRHLFHTVRPGGIYIVEDVRGTPGDTSAVDYFCGMQREVVRRIHKPGQTTGSGTIPAGISHVEVFPGVVAVWKEAPDGLDDDFDRLEQLVRQAEGTEPLFHLAQYIHRNGGPLDRALVLCRSALATEPNNPWMHFELSKILAHMDDIPGATDSINRALELAKTDRAVALFREHLTRISAR